MTFHAVGTSERAKGCRNCGVGRNSQTSVDAPRAGLQGVQIRDTSAESLEAAGRAVARGQHTAEVEVDQKWEAGPLLVESLQVPRAVLEGSAVQLQRQSAAWTREEAAGSTAPTSEVCQRQHWRWYTGCYYALDPAVPPQATAAWASG